jgi:hypothetical protein
MGRRAEDVIRSARLLRKPAFDPLEPSATHDAIRRALDASDAGRDDCGARHLGTCCGIGCHRRATITNASRRLFRVG